MSLTDLLIAALATNQIVEIWLDSSIFKPWQDWLKERKGEEKGWRVRRPAELLTCPFCLMPWVALGVLVVLFMCGTQSAWRLPVYMFAVARLSHLVNDVRAYFSEPTVVDETEKVNSFLVIDEQPGHEAPDPPSFE